MAAIIEASPLPADEEIIEGSLLCQLNIHMLSSRTGERLAQKALRCWGARRTDVVPEEEEEAVTRMMDARRREERGS
jgi:hypothetical protein